MGIRTVRPLTNGQRDMTYSHYGQLTVKGPTVKRLLVVGRKTTGRANGTITCRHRGGGTRPRYRLIDFNGTAKLGIPGKVATIEYDPSRTANIAMIVFVDGDKRYQLAHKNMKVGDEVITDRKAKVREGNRMQIQNIPVGHSLYNLEIFPNRGGQYVRSAGASAKLMSVEGDLAQIQLGSGEIRLVPKICYATIGELSNEDHSLVRLGKAGRVRLKGRRPQVRGKAMNPCDHPHGGGEGNCPIGMKYPKTPWGAHALGVKTRSNKSTEKYIAKSRHRAKR